MQNKLGQIGSKIEHIDTKKFKVMCFLNHTKRDDNSQPGLSVA
jgi:hypothetical protein